MRPKAFPFFFFLTSIPPPGVVFHHPGKHRFNGRVAFSLLKKETGWERLSKKLLYSHPKL
jgi:hypothetical protein